MSEDLPRDISCGFDFKADAAHLKGAPVLVLDEVFDEFF